VRVDANFRGRGQKRQPDVASSREEALQTDRKLLLALTPAGRSFLIDARRILEDCEVSIKKAQRISAARLGNLAIGYVSAMTHDFLGKALAVWPELFGNHRRLHRDEFRSAGESAA
jgi:DNA-binding transcriptional LysR family regulator